MAVLNFVKVAADGAGKAIANLKHSAAGPAGEDLYGQVAHIADPTDPSKVAGVAVARPGPAAGGMVVRDAPHNVDTGSMLLTAAIQTLVAADVYGHLLLITNITDQARWITIQDGSGHECLSQYPLPPREFRSIPLGGAKFTGGVFALTDTDSSVRAQFVGDQ